jgi:hypothetical protein
MSRLCQFFFDLLASGLRYIYTEVRYIMRVIVGGMRKRQRNGRVTERYGVPCGCNVIYGWAGSGGQVCVAMFGRSLG